MFSLEFILSLVDFCVSSETETIFKDQEMGYFSGN